MYKMIASKKTYCIKKNKKKNCNSQHGSTCCWVSNIRKKTKLSLRAGMSKSMKPLLSPKHVNEDILHF